MSEVTEVVYQSHLHGLELLNRGKVRDVYAVDDERLLIVVTDRLSAFDVVLPDPIPGKGQVLTDLSEFWFARTRDLVANHCTGIDPVDVLASPGDREQVEGRSMVVRRLRPLPVEAIVRGYLIGSGWKDYQSSGAVCGIELPSGLRQADRLPRDLFTPSTKAEIGEHDENIDFDETVRLVGREVAEKVRDLSIAVYRSCADYAAEHGIIIADTKFEFALGDDGEPILIDEVVTPDSSRFWPADEYAPGSSPPSFDKQFVRDYLETLGWDKRPPAPHLPEDVLRRTSEKYAEARARLLG